MKLYHKINSLFKRDEKSKKFRKDEYSQPEFALLKPVKWSWTEKLDGTNVRIGWGQDQKFRYGGRTEDAQMPVHLMEALRGNLTEGKIRELFPDASELTLYGEGIGKKIQAVGKFYNPEGHEFVLFDARVGNWWLKREDVIDIARRLNIRVAKEIGVGTFSDAIDLVAQGFDSEFGNCKAEGLILRLDPELLDRSGHRIITKLKTKDFARGWHE